MSRSKNIIINMAKVLIMSTNTYILHSNISITINFLNDIIMIIMMPSNIIKIIMMPSNIIKTIMMPTNIIKIIMMPTNIINTIMIATNIIKIITMPTDLQEVPGLGGLVACGSGRGETHLESEVAIST